MSMNSACPGVEESSQEHMQVCECQQSHSSSLPPCHLGQGRGGELAPGSCQEFTFPFLNRD